MLYMSPASQAKRKKPAQYERTSNIRKLARYEVNEIAEQNDEMCAIVEEMGDEDLQKLFDEGGVGSILKDIWATCQRKEFTMKNMSIVGMHSPEPPPNIVTSER